MCEKCTRLRPNEAKYNIEKGYEYSIVKDYKNAKSCYNKASESNDLNSTGLTGLTYCLV